MKNYEKLRMTRGGTEYDYHAAAQDTVMEITSTNGTVVEQYRYDVYGKPQYYDGSGSAISGSAIGNRLLFQGRDRDPDTGLYNFRFRYYSPTLGRFVQPDPLRFEWLDGVRHDELIKHALYCFVANTPAVSIDPLGLSTTSEEFWKMLNESGDYTDCFAKCMAPEIGLDGAAELFGAYEGLGRLYYGLRYPNWFTAWGRYSKVPVPRFASRASAVAAVAAMYRSLECWDKCKDCDQEPENSLGKPPFPIPFDSGTINSPPLYAVGH
jgi:RHS repeat-associated protein